MNDRTTPTEPRKKNSGKYLSKIDEVPKEIRDYAINKLTPRTDQQEAARALAAQAMKTFKQEQAARILAAQAMEKFKAEQARKAQEQRQESKLAHVDKESKQERGR